MDEVNNINYIKALEYHFKDKPGKISVVPTKSLATQQDLAMAYSPGVAAPCLEIFKNQDAIYRYTARGNLVAVVTNGTAVLGLGNLGAAASKPVMEGKAVLFKIFADIDAIDLEIDTLVPEEFINIVKQLNYTFGGINLEDIKAPECFIIEQQLQNIMQIPVFHDDQHGTAIIVVAGLINAAYLTNRSFHSMKVVVNGAGAAAIACVELLIFLGVDKKNVTLCDRQGVIFKGRKSGMNFWKELYASDTNHRSLKEAIKDADVFLGLSSKGAVTQDMVLSMNDNPIIFAMANPDPEITPEDIIAVRTDAIIATGRSDYNNQVNNVMGFPYVFRGALDIRASKITQEMKIAAAYAIAHLARQPVPCAVYKAYPNRKMVFGSDYIIPVPFDPRLITTVPLAVAEAAIKSGVAGVKNFDLMSYQEDLEFKFNPTLRYIKYVIKKLSSFAPRKIVFSYGEETEVIMAAITMSAKGYGTPILLGKEEQISIKMKSIGVNDFLSHAIGVVDINSNINKYAEILFSKIGSDDFSYKDCKELIRSNNNIFSTLMVENKDADCCVLGFQDFPLDSFIPKIKDLWFDKRVFSYYILFYKERPIIIVDNSLCAMFDAKSIVDIVFRIVRIAKILSLSPKVALISEFNNKKNQEAHNILNNMLLDFEYLGDVSLNVALQNNLVDPDLSKSANILIMSQTSSSQIFFELLNSVFIGPIFCRTQFSIQSVKIGNSSTEIINSGIFACLDAIEREIN